MFYDYNFQYPMYQYQPYGFNYPLTNQNFRAEMPNLTSFIRLFHASPNLPGVDVYIDDNLVAKDLVYQQFTNYLPIAAGEYDFKVYPTGNTTNPILVSRGIGIAPNSIQSFAIMNNPVNLSLLSIPEPHMAVSPSMVFLRVVNLSPNAPALDITLPNGQQLFKDVSFKDITGYIMIPPGNYTLLIKPSGTERTVLTAPNFIVKPSRFYTVYVTGLLPGRPELQIIQALDGVSYLR